MPLIAHSDLPTYHRLKAEGIPILEPGRASQQDIRELHIGILNMMQDEALEATERQLVRLLGNSSHIMQVYVHLLHIDGISRGEQAETHIQKYYTAFEDIKSQGLDALILTGTNLSASDITSAPFWKAFCQVIEWADKNVASTLCSCLATHAVIHHLYGIERTPLPGKLWGIYEHVKTQPAHRLLQPVNTRFFVPHSRHHDISTQALEKAGIPVLLQSHEAGMHMATSKDGFRFVFFQGHPEYDTHSLLKEYKREVMRFINEEIKNYPPYPSNYFSLQSCAILDEYEQNILSKSMQSLDFPEQIIEQLLENIWRDSAKSIINNWIDCVYQTTHLDRIKQYMDGIDPENPLGSADI